MSDLNRDQFEAYAKSKGWEDRHLKQRDDGGYEDWGVHPIWLSWQASRECLVIELPEAFEFDDPYHAGQAISECKKSILISGVKIK